MLAMPESEMKVSGELIPSEVFSVLVSNGFPALQSSSTCRSNMAPLPS